MLPSFKPWQAHDRKNWVWAKSYLKERRDVKFVAKVGWFNDWFANCASAVGSGLEELCGGYVKQGKSNS